MSQQNGRKEIFLRVNRDVRAPKVRVITEKGEQLGIMSSREALERAIEMGMDLVEIAPNADPPVCKIIDYGKLRYQQTKKDKENKKAQHQVKVKELKLKPNIDKHDLGIKINHAREFLSKGHKVRFTCMFRGREIVFADIGKEIIESACVALADIASPESPPKLMGKNMSVTLAPGASKKGSEQRGNESKS
jgi:translation initiation factor IF-3